MELFTNKLVSGVIQVILFSIIPLVWWFVTARKKENFFQWLGLKKIKQDKGFIKSCLLVLFCFLALSVIPLFIMRGVETATSEFYGLGVSALPAAFVYAFLNTSFSEEILFRGFILKRISNRFGFVAGNTIQAAAFGVLHGVMLLSTIGMLKAIVIAAFTGLIGWFMGYVNEKKAHGSILPSWIIHGVSNLFSSLIALFSII